MRSPCSGSSGRKEHLIEAVVGSAFGPASQARRRPAVAEASAPTSSSFAQRYEDLLVANLPLIRTMIGEIHRHAVCQHQALKGIFWPMRAALVERLKQAAASGEARRDIKPALVADFFSGAIFSSVIRGAKRPGRREYGAAAYRAASLDILLSGILRK